MSTQHTPGPWVVNPIQLDQICTADARLEIARATRYSNAQETIANAQLLAAAPILLAELKRVREVIAAWNEAFIESVTTQSTGLIDDPDDVLTAEADQDLLNGIDAAILKATGG